MFKVGEKIVFIGPVSNPTGIYPELKEIVTCDGPSICYANSIYIKEYPFNKSGGAQSFRQHLFRKLSEVSGEMSEEILNEVLTTVEEPVEV